LNQNNTTNTIAYKNAVNRLHNPKILGPPKSGALCLSLFSLMVNPPLAVCFCLLLQTASYHYL